MVLGHLLQAFPHGEQGLVLLDLSPQWVPNGSCVQSRAGVTIKHRIDTSAAPWEFGAAWFGQDKFQESGNQVPKNPLARREASASPCYKKWL